MLTLKQTLSYLNISESTLYRLMHSGKLTGYRVGVRWKFKQSEIDNYLVKHASSVRTDDRMSLQDDRQTVSVH